jgi:hypothetical protein
MHFFCSKYVFLSFLMSFFDIIGNDSLVVKALECGWKYCGFSNLNLNTHHEKNPKFKNLITCTTSTNDQQILYNKIKFPK